MPVITAREVKVEVLIETRKLKTHFLILKGILRRPVGAVKAVDGVNLVINSGQWMGLVGESGCGKTTLGKTILRLIKPTSGHIYFNMPHEIKEEIELLEVSGSNHHKLQTMLHDYDLAVFPSSKIKTFRKKMQLVHQDPYTSLNPRMKIKNIVA